MRPKSVLLLILILTAGNINAQRVPIAVPEGIRAGLTNPAGLADTRSAGLGATFDAPATFSSVGTVDLMLNGPGSGYALSIDAPSSSLNHVLSFGVPLGRLASVGGSWSWRQGAIRDGNGVVGLLVRPAAPFSVGAVAESPTAGSVFYRLGAAVRPFGAVQARDSIVTMSVDAQATHDLGEGEVQIALPTAGISFEPVPGLLLSGSYAFEDSTLLLSLETRTPRSALSVGAFFDPEFQAQRVHATTHTTLGENHTVLDQRSARMVRYDGPTLLDERPAGAFVGFPSTLLGQESVHEIADHLESLAEDPVVNGVFFDDVLFSGSFAAFLEVEAALQAFRERDKRVVFYFTSVDALNYALAASTATDILLHPLGSLAVTGFSSGRFYLEEFFERYGVDVVDLGSHEYKTAYDNLTESRMTDAEREALSAVTRDRYETFLQMIRSGRGDTLNGDVADLVADGPYLVADEALDAGLVDALVQPQAIEEELEVEEITTYRPVEIIDDSWRPEPADALAIIFATGPISVGPGVAGQSVGSEGLVAAIEAAADDPSIRGVLLRVDSGGGSALASSVIAESVQRLVDEGKPIVVSMGGAAASGGYYISAYADRIVASPVTITGSIGVTGLTFSFAEALSNLGIQFDVVETAPNGTFALPFESLRDDDIARFEQTIDSLYEDFVGVVAEGRDLSQEDVDAVARGRIWTGAQSVELGLVDSVGNLEDAMEFLAELAEVGTDYRVEEIPAGQTFPSTALFQAILSRAVGVASIPELEFARTLGRFKPGEPLFLMPYVFSE